MGENLLNCVYRFKDVNGEIIYIGSAKILEGRIKGLEHTTKHLPDKAYEEVKLIQYISFDTENNARFAEEYLIKKHRPKYNKKYADKPINLNVDEIDTRKWGVYEFKKSAIKDLLEKFKKEKLRTTSNGTLYLTIKIKENFQDMVFYLACYPSFKELTKDGFYNENMKKLREINVRLNDKILSAFHKELENYSLLRCRCATLIALDTTKRKPNTTIDFSKYYVDIKHNAFQLKAKVGVCCKNYCRNCKNTSSCDKKEYELQFNMFVKCE